MASIGFLKFKFCSQLSMVNCHIAVTCLKSQSYKYLEADDGVTVYKKFVWVGEVSCKVEILIRNIGLV